MINTNRICSKNFGTRKAEVLNSIVMKSTANENDINGLLQTFR